MNAVPNSVVLMFVRGWQGGTIHQIARELDTTPTDIETADLDRMGVLMRLAQERCRDAGEARRGRRPFADFPAIGDGPPLYDAAEPD